MAGRCAIAYCSPPVGDYNGSVVSAVSSTFADFAARWHEQIESALADRCAPAEGCPARLGDAIRYSLLAPGKRLRPMLVLLAAEAGGAEADRAMPAACAVEMIHAYSLIHDDLPAMDDDDLRRGRPSCHRHFDEATAILAGDALQALAFETLAAEVQPPAVAAACCATLARAAGRCRLVGGQADDMQPPTAELAHDGRNNHEQLLDQLASIHHRKTGALMRASVQLGGLVAQVDDDSLLALDRYGRHLGLLFQITDDLLDVVSNEKAVGKAVGKDAQRGKLTYPGLIGVEASLRRAGELAEQARHALRPLGSAAAGLDALVVFVLQRNR